ncbi:MAG: hypothetical protein AMXMBFR56_60760 [Polyangiaceae bacterium]
MFGAEDHTARERTASPSGVVFTRSGQASFPSTWVLDELASGELHMTGLFSLSGHLTEDNAEQLLAEARGKSKRQLEELLARWFPRPDVPPTITPVTLEPAQWELSTWPGAGNPAPPPLGRVEPLSPESVRVDFTARAAFRDKLEQASALLSHTVPSGDLATILELALDPGRTDRECVLQVAA